MAKKKAGKKKSAPKPAGSSKTPLKTPSAPRAPRGAIRRIGQKPPQDAPEPKEPEELEESESIQDADDVEEVEDGDIVDEGESGGTGASADRSGDLPVRLPEHYGEDMLRVVVRDPRWVHCYWSLEGGACQRVIDQRGGGTLGSGRWVLRVTPRGEASYDVDVQPGSRSWSLSLQAGRRYRIEIGVILGDGSYVALAAGNEVELPAEAPRDGSGAEWAFLSDELRQLAEFFPLGASMLSLGSHSLLSGMRLRREGLRSPDRNAEGWGEGYDGYLMLVLHAHLPYVRHPEHSRFLEEDWLFEAITETYAPLADALGRLAAEGATPRVSIVLSPTLCEMLVDPLLQQRYHDHLQRLIGVADAAMAKMKGSSYHNAAEMYCSRLRQIDALYKSWGRNPLSAFRKLQEAGAIEILTCAATHGLLPLMQTTEAVRAQIAIGCNNYEKHFGCRPQGIWLPECAYAPGLDKVLAEHGIRYFFLDSHGVLNGSPRPQFLSYRPILTPSGVAAFARDTETGVQVWSAEHGYPGDRIYREFYRDLGYDGDYELVRPCLHPDGARRNIGLKYHRITERGALAQKEPYVPAWARQCAAAHAEHFIATNEDAATRLRGAFGARPVICAMYDAELFGHWWYEGIEFLENAIRRAARPSSRIRTVTPRDYFADEHPIQVVAPSASSWGDKGYYEHWLNGANDWIYPHLHKAESRMAELAARYNSPDALQRRALNQAARELLLAQASDWAFLMSTGTAKPYATRRTQDHVARFTRLYEMLVGGSLSGGEVQELEKRDAIFQEIDYRVYMAR